MSSRHQSDEDAFGNDSFLDVVCNMVGIVIILVMVVGTRAQATMAPEPAEAPQEIDDLKSKVVAITADAIRQAKQVDELHGSMSVRDAERNRLAQIAALKRRELEAARAKMDQAARDDFDRQRALAMTQAAIDDLQNKIGQVKPSKETIKIVTYPTPISTTVDGAEGHFMLRGGRIVHIPLEDLVDELKDDAKQKVWKLRDRAEITETLAPQGGFRLVYTLGKHDVSVREQRQGAAGGTVVLLEQWTLVPISGNLGEPIEEALAKASRFHAAVAQYDTRKTVMTLWVYPDSFGAYREIKEDLHKLGYKSAGRPLPDGVPISGSPDGSKSSAQ